jgi:hypothetical protein
MDYNPEGKSSVRLNAVGTFCTSITEFKLQPASRTFTFPRVMVDTAATYPFFASYNSSLCGQSFSAVILCYCTFLN